GLKPTKGRWSARGVVPACRTLDCVSVFTSTAADAARIDDVIAGFDPADPYSREANAGPQEHVPASFRVGIPPEHQLEWFSDVESARLFKEATARIVA